MQTFNCTCGATLFFGNTHCVKCEHNVGWCEACSRVTAVGESRSSAGAPALRCLNPRCARRVEKCRNYTDHGVCNRLVPAGDGPLCGSCRLTTIIPDVGDAARVARWGRLEEGKRRLLYELDLLGIPYDARHGVSPPVSFRFPESTPDERVMTGHADGVITIALEEADPVRRERARQKFNEPHRTLIGHFRHEFAHYVWMTLVEPGHLQDFTALMGDPNSPPYADALQRYYDQGPPDDWQQNYISAYATAHPWEDFAETFAFYLDMHAVLDTGAAHGLTPRPTAGADITRRLKAYADVGLKINELNRTMGLTDLLPEVVSTPVVQKLTLIDRLLTGKLATHPKQYTPPAPHAGQSQSSASHAAAHGSGQQAEQVRE